MPSSNNSTAKKKSETCEGKLRRICKNIAQELTDGKTKKGDNIYVEDFMEGVYDIEWITHRDKSYKAARLMVAGGGPTIWVNLQTNTVDGYWWTDKCSHGFIDNLGLDYYCEEMYGY